MSARLTIGASEVAAKKIAKKEVEQWRRSY